MDLHSPDKKIRAAILKDMLTGISLCLVIVAVTLYLPLLGFLMAILLPMPVLFYRLKLGRTMGAVIGAAVLCIIAAAAGQMSVDTLFYGALLLTGFTMGECIERQFSVAATGVCTCLVILGVVLFMVLAHTTVTGNALVPMVSAYVGTNLELTLKLYRDMGVSQETMGVITDSLETIRYVLVRILPALMLSMLMVVVWSNILFIKKVLTQKQIHLSVLDHLNRWQAPELLVWAVIISGLGLFLPVSAVKIAGLNALIALLPVYFFQGIAIVSFFFEKKQVPRMVKVFVYGIIALQQIFLLVVVGLGFFDTWLNFRKLDTPAPPAE